MKCKLTAAEKRLSFANIYVLSRNEIWGNSEYTFIYHFSSLSIPFITQGSWWDETLKVVSLFFLISLLSVLRHQKGSTVYFPSFPSSFSASPSLMNECDEVINTMNNWCKTGSHYSHSTTGIFIYTSSVSNVKEANVRPDNRRQDEATPKQGHTHTHTLFGDGEGNKRNQGLS